MCLIGKAVEFRFLINKDWVIKNKRFTVGKQTYRDKVLIILFQMVKKMSPTGLTKSSLGLTALATMWTAPQRQLPLASREFDIEGFHANTPAL